VATLRIPVRNRNFPDLYATIDEEDADVVCCIGPWYAKKVGNTFVVRSHTWDPSVQQNRGFFLHQVVMGLPGEAIDHRDGNALNNTKANLRICSQSQNMCNSARSNLSASGFRGVYRHHRGHVWKMEIRCGGERVFSTHATAEEAALAYDEVARRLHGEFAVLNFPRTGEQGVLQRMAARHSLP